MVASDNEARKQENKKLVLARQSEAAAFTSEFFSFWGFFKGNCIQTVE